MTARATFTQADMQRAIRAAAKEGATVRVVSIEGGQALEFIPKGQGLTPPAPDPTKKKGKDPARVPGKW